MAMGRSIPMWDAEARVRGTVPYLSNFRLPGMLVAKVLRSPLPHAWIRRLDPAPALSIPGVVAVLTAADFERPGAPHLFYGVERKDQPVVARERVRYVGEPVALVAAETPEAAEAALRAIAVEYEELPAVFDPVAAVQTGAPILHADCPDNIFAYGRLRHGDLAAGFAAADEIVEEVYATPPAHHAALEPHGAIALWEGEGLTIWTTTQAPFVVQRVLAELFDLPLEAVRVIVPPLGGGYGGKGYVRLEPMVAALAWKVRGRPVRLVLERWEEFITVTRHTAYIRIRTGVRRDGTLTARQVEVYWGSGAYADVTPQLLRSAGLVRVVGPYRIPAVRVDAYGVYTNLPPAGPFRGTMSFEGAWAYESHMDTIAHRLGMDPLELRRRNLLRPGDRFCTGEVVEEAAFLECLEAAAQGVGWDRPLERGGETRRRGRGLAVMMKSTIPRSRSECRIVLRADGTLTLYTATVEMGQGAHTVLAQIAAEETGIPIERIEVSGPDTARVPYDATTSASRSTSMMGAAIREAARQIREALLRSAAPILESEPDALSIQDGWIVDVGRPELRFPIEEVLRRSGLEILEAHGIYETVGGLDPETGQGMASPHWHQGAGACEIEVDIETGAIKVLRYCAAVYAGRVVNPELAALQNEGNVIFGLGQALMEQIIFNQGQPINANLSDYAIPSLRDLPCVLEGRLLESPEGTIHGIGEMALPPVAPAIANALFDAVGIRLYDLPITPEKVWRALHGQTGTD
jgi:CO/xanthine dehydrogenase Mo-binding subunit